MNLLKILVGFERYNTVVKSLALHKAACVSGDQSNFSLMQCYIQFRKYGISFVF